MSTVLTKTYPAPPVDEREILRYAGCRGEADDALLALCRGCVEEAAGALTYALCYAEFPLRVEGDLCDFGAFSLRSGGLAKNLGGCPRAVVFAATVGVGIDRLILRYGRLSPSRAVMLGAVGAERIEALCDAFCADLAAEGEIRPRFSPGYGDLPLESQRDIFAVLNPAKRIGLTLSASLLMSPSKSVTAFVGVR